ncbi:MAG TPA: arylamine N-acetyltransferase [Aliidongia sp.]|uniref:arylamine N-acetyltransferase family protein n=1 Tax=Aliidongia sp. TaxID=1914230 RepID=UPI002DDCCF55|nr:arylamine N-acetyltransferase [Aliidongia sp.]HEV2672999.1 arylamine N-acetyltransferase [Aliidongia sp.]
MTNPSRGVDLDAYFARVGYRGSRHPTLETLAALQALHPAAIPFEAIDLLLGRPIDLSPPAVDAKLIGAARGGYCFEQNGLFKRVLEALGFQVAGMMGRVYWMNPGLAGLPARTHMALRVTIDGEPWLSDVGFGTRLPTAPLRFSDPAAQLTRHDSFRLRPSDEGHALEVLIDGNWVLVYDLSREPPADIDYVVGNWFTSSHPNSRFRHNLMVARTADEARYTLLGNHLTIRPPGEAPRRLDLDAAQVLDALGTLFLLRPEPGWTPMIEWMVASAG